MMRTSEIRIYNACPKDINTVYSMLYELAEYESLEKEFTLSKEKLEKTLFEQNNMASAIIASRAGKPAGIIIYYFTISTFSGKRNLFIEDFFVKPEERRNRIGTALFNYITGIAEKQKCARVEWKVLADNEPALRFYKKAGGKEDTRWKTYQKDCADSN